jgi:hypothetical protein
MKLDGIQVMKVLINSLLLKYLSLAYVVLGEFATIHLRVLVFEGQRVLLANVDHDEGDAQQYTNDN